MFGAGYLGAALVRQLVSSPHSEFVPVAILDDDPRKHHLRIMAVEVVGSLDDLASVVARTRAATLVVAISQASPALLARATELAAPLGVTVKALPPLGQVLRGTRQMSDLRDLEVEDILDRVPIDTDLEAMRNYLTGQRVLVTGAGGSIGSELCAQISRFNPVALVMLDRDESGLQDVQLRVSGHGLLTSPDVVLADIRDTESLTHAFETHRPQVVFHAAALKHLPLLQQYPDEAWKTNVLGTRNVLEAAMAVGTEIFINISTDKAADPVSVLGHSKQLAERLTAHAAAEVQRRYLSVRFGNVLGSRGSMLPLFTTMIERGGPITITHPDVTRFFMTIPEACQLVIQAGSIGDPGEVLVLDMGEPVRILDIANRLIELSGRTDIRIVFTGLREGEKLNETLRSAGEFDVRPKHPLISHITTLRPLDPTHLDWPHFQKQWSASVPNESTDAPGEQP